VSCFPFSSFASFAFYLFQFFAAKNDDFDSLTVVRQKLMCVGHPGDEDFSSFFKVINKIL